MSNKTKAKTKIKQPKDNCIKIIAIIAIICDVILYFAITQRFYLVYLTLWLIPILNILNYFLGKKISQRVKINQLLLFLALVAAQIILAVIGIIANICINHGLKLCATHDNCIISEYPADFLLLVTMMAQFNMIGLYIGAFVGSAYKKK